MTTPAPIADEVLHSLVEALTPKPYPGSTGPMLLPGGVDPLDLARELIAAREVLGRFVWSADAQQRRPSDSVYIRPFEIDAARSLLPTPREVPHA